MQIFADWLSIHSIQKKGSVIKFEPTIKKDPEAAECEKIKPDRINKYYTI